MYPIASHTVLVFHVTAFLRSEIFLNNPLYKSFVKWLFKGHKQHSLDTLAQNKDLHRIYGILSYMVLAMLDSIDSY